MKALSHWIKHGRLDGWGRDERQAHTPSGIWLAVPLLSRDTGTWRENVCSLLPCCYAFQHLSAKENVSACAEVSECAWGCARKGDSPIDQLGCCTRYLLFQWWKLQTKLNYQAPKVHCAHCALCSFFLNLSLHAMKSLLFGLFSCF